MEGLSSAKGSVRSRLLFYISIGLILFGGLLAYLVQTGFGSISIKDISYKGSNGKTVRALLYVPKGVSSTNKAPGVVVTHGYINSRETADGFAIELSRRGYVVLAVDQPGHGFSEPPAYANAFGGKDSIRYIRTLDFVDTDNIGIMGHSMGGWASVGAAASCSDCYKSVLLASSAPGVFGMKEGTPDFPRNTAVIFSTFDEFSMLMYGVPLAKDVVKSARLKKLFGVTEDVVAGKLYGSVEKGTARKLYSPQVIHPKVHFSGEGIANAVEWMNLTLKGGKNIPLNNQVWHWKELGNFIALTGMVILIFSLGKMLLATSFFSELAERTPEIKGSKGIGRWVAVIINAVITLVLFIVAIGSYNKAYQVAGKIWPQSVTNTIAYWAIFLGVVTLVLFLLWHLALNRRKGASFVNYGVAWQSTGMNVVKIGKSLLLAFIIGLVCYLTVELSYMIFTSDYRLWVFAIKPMTALHVRIFFCYVLAFVFFFIISGMSLHGQLRSGGRNGSEPGLFKEIVVNIFILLLPYIVFEALGYMSLFGGKTLAIPEAALFYIVMFQFFPVFGLAGAISTYFFRKTGHIYTGAFLNAIIVTWIMVAGTATHFPL